MNNKDRIAEQENIIANAQSYIKELERQQGKRFKPGINDQYWYIRCGRLDSAKHLDSVFFDNCFNSFNCYETEELAIKAAAMMKRNNAIIMACLMVDPDFVPDYLSGNQRHWSLVYVASGWKNELDYTSNYGPSVSTPEKLQEAAALLTEWGVE
ncbi:MAG: hypothetical protein ACI9RI_000870 [Oceanospirillaceae bacterium]|jgi:hypothetical protein